MDFIKKLTGVVSGLFFTLVMAWGCSFALNTDLTWYNELYKPAFMPTSSVMTALVSVVYVVHILVVARLVTGRHFFPSLLFLGGVGILSVLFLNSFFKVHNLYLAFSIIIMLFALSLVTEIRFFIKDVRTALYYLPIFVFNAFCFVLTTCCVFAN